MTAEEIVYTEAARALVLRGVDTLAAAVKGTLGTRGRTVVLASSVGPVTVTKDGVTSARAVQLQAQFEKLGAQMVREIVGQTGDDAADGTTTVRALAHAIVGEGVRLVAAGVHPMDLKRAIDRAVESAVASLGTARPTQDAREVTQVSARPPQDS